MAKLDREAQQIVSILISKQISFFLVSYCSSFYYNIKHDHGCSAGCVVCSRNKRADASSQRTGPQHLHSSSVIMSSLLIFFLESVI